jgi:hypothetical protein
MHYSQELRMPRAVGATPTTRRAAFGLTLAPLAAPRLAGAQQRQEPGGARVVRPASAGAPSITLSPHEPGTLYETVRGAGAIWNTTANVANVARLGYAVVRPDFVWRDAGTEVAVPNGGTAAVPIAPRLAATGDFVKLYDADDPNRISADSGRATVLQGRTGGGAPARADVDFARAWIAPLTLGVNVERGWAWGVPGGVPAFAAYLKRLGLTHVRLFYPWRPGLAMLGEPAPAIPPTEAQFARILDAAAQYIAAGLKVELAMTDVIGMDEDLLPHGAAVTRHIAAAARSIKALSFDSTKIAIGAWNELAGDADYSAYQAEWYAILRAALPGHVLVLGSNYWQHRSRLIDRPPFVRTDGRTIWPIHSYETMSAAEWATVRDQLRAWSAAFGDLVVMWSETGLGDPSAQRTDPAAWLANMRDMFPAMAEFRPTVWAVTYGGGGRLNRSSTDPTLLPALESAVVRLQRDIAAQLGVSEPPPPTAGSRRQR